MRAHGGIGVRGCKQHRLGWRRVSRGAQNAEATQPSFLHCACGLDDGRQKDVSWGVRREAILDERAWVVTVLVLPKWGSACGGMCVPPRQRTASGSGRHTQHGGTAVVVSGTAQGLMSCLALAGAAAMQRREARARGPRNAGDRRGKKRGCVNRVVTCQHFWGKVMGVGVKKTIGMKSKIARERSRPRGLRCEAAWTSAPQHAPYFTQHILNT